MATQQTTQEQASLEPVQSQQPTGRAITPGTDPQPVDDGPG